ncbi:MAG: sulfotransferase domain-containing protein [Acidobacteria bacterium]|nr:sulfotransferase domain-containing protein [Acidobacteriota bacterium]
MPRTQWREWLRPRRLLRRLRTRLFPPPYGVPPPLVVNGFPKGGTHLLVRCVTVLGGQQRFDFFLYRKMERQLGLAPVSEGGDGIPLGIGEPTLVAAEEVERRLGSLVRGEFAAGHIPYSEALARVLERHGLRMLLILRDPRDVCVSLVHHIKSRPENRLHDYFTRTLKSDEERLLATIVGVEAAKTRDGVRLGDIGERLDSATPWMKLPFCSATRFERLVGPEGGGSAEAQQAEIRRIAGHLGLSLSVQQIESVAGKLFGQGSVTFRRGEIGGWRESFTAEHKAAFKRVAGKQLAALGYEGDLSW